MGKYLSIGIIFDDIDINSALSYLFSVAFKDFFKPVSVKYLVKYASSPHEELSGVLGIDNPPMRYDEFLPEEKYIKNISLTVYEGKTCLDELISLSEKKILKFRFDIIGIANIAYEEKSMIKEGWFFRECEENNEKGVVKVYLEPLFEVSIYSVGMSVYSSSDIFLRASNLRNNIKCADQNLQSLCKRLALFADELPQIRETDFSLKGSVFWNEFDRLREKIKILPKFADSEYKFIQSKKI